MSVGVFWLCACIVLSKVHVHAQNVPESRVVNIAQGPVRGYKDSATDVFAFYNIPYAQAPLGLDRYKAPLSPLSWNETFEAVDKKIICPQNAFTRNQMISTEHINMTEDCLIVNVFVPDTQETNLPVLVIIHGGAYFIGYGNMLTPKALVNSKKLIAITFNYRLGISGFLCLGTKDVPGNAAMKDQVALLRWVRENIATFGGNPNDVTVNGCSAGGASVELLTLSKLTDGLMNKAIAESGSSIGAFAVQFDPLQNAKNYALRLNFTDVDDINALEDFYKSLTLEELIKDSQFSNSKDSAIALAVCIEKDVGQERFLEEAPINILRNGNYRILPTYYSYAYFEGLIRLPLFNRWKDLMNEKFSDFLPADLKFENADEREEVANTVRQYYFGNETVSNSTILSYLNYFGDTMFIHSILRSVSEQVRAGNNAVYLMEYSFTHNMTQSIPHTDVRGPGHCHQTVAVMDADESVLPEDFVVVKNILRELWLNFVTTGNPTPAGWNSTLPTWLPAGANRSPHYHLGQTIQAAGVPAQGAPALWDAIYEKHYRTPIPPSNSATTLPRTLLVLLVTLKIIMSLQWSL